MWYLVHNTTTGGAQRADTINGNEAVRRAVKYGDLEASDEDELMVYKLEERPNGEPVAYEYNGEVR